MRYISILLSCFMLFFVFVGGVSAASLGTCGNNGAWTCTLTNPGPANTNYVGKAAGSQCAINATKAGAARGTTVYCCNKGPSGTINGKSLSTCTGSNGKAAGAFCRTSCASGDVAYTDTVPNDQCSINATNANVARNTPVYCECGKGSEKPCPPATTTPVTSPAPTESTDTPIPTIPTEPAVVSLVVQLPGIGGLFGGNANPSHPTRNITLYLYRQDQDPTNLNDKPVIINSTMNLNKTNGTQTYGYFINPNLTVGQLNGQYQIFLKSNQYLQAQIRQTNNTGGDVLFQLTGGQTTNLPQVTLIAGDIFPPGTSGNYGDNTLDISDYNMLISCYGDKADTGSCPNKTAADLNDDGLINGIDYNILLRGFNTLQTGGF